MFTFNDLYIRLQKVAGYDSAEDIQWGKDSINEAEKYFARKRNWPWTEKEFTFTSTASQLTVDLPADYGELISFKLTIGTVDYIPEYIPSGKRFDEIQASSTTNTSAYPVYFHIRANKLKLYPGISGAGNTGTILYQFRPVDMSAADYTTGTITATNGDETITGSGTTFTAAMVGRYLKTTDGKWYKIASYTSATALELDIPYEGTTEIGASYTIGELPTIPEDFQDLLWIWPLSRWWMIKADEERARIYINEAERLLEEMETRYSTKAYKATSTRYAQARTIDPNFDPAAIDIT